MFLLREGKIQAEGSPLDVMSSLEGSSFLHLDGVRNTFPATIEDQSPGHGITRLRLVEGPLLTVPSLEPAEPTSVMVEVRADDILLARAPVAGLSAQNLIEGTVERVVTRGHDAEVLVRTGGVTWIVSIVEPAAQQLALSPGVNVHMIIKARSCHVRVSSPSAQDR
jgi:molybdate transport system ATP-binding protein